MSTKSYNCLFFPYWLPSLSYELTENKMISRLDVQTYDPGSSEFQQFQNEAFDSFTDQAPDTYDVLNALRDLLTLRGLWKQISETPGRLYKRLMAIPQKRSTIGVVQKPWRLMTLREQLFRIGAVGNDALDLSKALSSSYLLNEFGVKPLIRDIEEVFVAVQPALERLAFLRSTVGQNFPAHYTKTFALSKPDFRAGVADASLGSYNYLWYRNIQGYVRYTAAAKVRNRIRGLWSVGAQAEMILAAMGAGDPLVFLWDLVPFSFVLDWFVGIDKWLTSHGKIQPFAGELQVRDVGVSIKKHITADLMFEGNGMTPNQLLFGRAEVKLYSRKPGLNPDLSLYLPTVNLTSKQQAILLALAVQRA
jgi:hypothetical protein